MERTTSVNLTWQTSLQTSLQIIHFYQCRSSQNKLAIAANLFLNLLQNYSKLDYTISTQTKETICSTKSLTKTQQHQESFTQEFRLMLCKMAMKSLFQYVNLVKWSDHGVKCDDQAT